MPHATINIQGTTMTMRAYGVDAQTLALAIGRGGVVGSRRPFHTGPHTSHPGTSGVEVEVI